MDDKDLQQYLANILFVMKFDGPPSQDEKDAFAQVCDSLNAGDTDSRTAEELVVRPDFVMRPAGSSADRLRNLQDLVYVAIIDGELTDLERVKVIDFAKQVGITQKQMNRIVAEAKIRCQSRGNTVCDGRESADYEPVVATPEIRPQIGINYKHVLQELSVNSKRPCEVIRELISNSYDACATEIRYYPLIQKSLSGFIFFDNGQGMSHTEKRKEITPYEAFFSIGYSTKTLEEHIGYKGQGSKLCFACRRFLLVTRCKGEADWRYKEIHNPREELSLDADIAPEYTSAPWQLLHKVVGGNPSKATSNILESLNNRFFEENFITGTMIVVLGFDVGPKFSRFFGTKNEIGTKLDKSLKHETSYIWNYIRCYTRHGDVRILNPETTGFSNKHRTLVEEPVRGQMPPPKLFVWVDEGVGAGHERFGQQLKEAPIGFPYLHRHVGEPPLDPKQVSQLRSGSFYARHAGTFEHEGRPYSWILAIDGNRRALNEYATLGRERSPRSGIPLTDQRGTYLCSQGIKICEFKELFSLVGGDYAILAEPKAFRHYVFLLNGHFELVTDRNAIKQSDEELLADRDFYDRIRKGLDGIRNGGPDIRHGVDHNGVFRSLLDRLAKDVQELQLEKELSKINRMKEELPRRGQFTIKSGPLKGKTFVYPGAGEENWVGVLYTLLAHFAPMEPKLSQSAYREFWVRPINMSGVSIDALALPLDVEGIPKAAVKGLEYKLSFSHEDLFNHPLLAVQYIACWEFSIPPVDKARVEDEFDYMGFVKLNEKYDSRVAYEIKNIQRTDRTDMAAGLTVKVISLKELIAETFDCEME